MKKKLVKILILVSCVLPLFIIVVTGIVLSSLSSGVVIGEASAINEELPVISTSADNSGSVYFYPAPLNQGSFSDIISMSRTNIGTDTHWHNNSRFYLSTVLADVVSFDFYISALGKFTVFLSGMSDPFLSVSNGLIDRSFTRHSVAQPLTTTFLRFFCISQDVTVFECAVTFNLADGSWFHVVLVDNPVAWNSVKQVINDKYNAGYNAGYIDSLSDTSIAYELSMREFSPPDGTSYIYNPALNTLDISSPGFTSAFSAFTIGPLYRFLGGTSYTLSFSYSSMQYFEDQRDYPNAINLSAIYVYSDGSSTSQVICNFPPYSNGQVFHFTTPGNNITYYSYVILSFTIPTVPNFNMTLRDLKIYTDSPFALGYDMGYLNGYASANDDYRQEAYDEGFSNGVAPISWFATIATGFAGFFDIQIFPGVSLSIILAIVLVPVLVGFLLRMLRGPE